MLNDPVVQIAVVGVVSMLVIVAVAFAMEALIDRGLKDDWHPFNPLEPAHCELCWQEHERRAAVLKRAQEDTREWARIAVREHRTDRARAMELVRR